MPSARKGKVMRITLDHTPQQLQEAEALYLENEKLVHFVLSRSFFDKLQDEDTQQIGRIGLWRACLTFDRTGKGKFSTYACKCIKNEILMRVRKNVAKKRDMPVPISLNAPVPWIAQECCASTVGDIVSGSPDVDFVDLDELFAGLTKGERRAICLTAAGLSQKEIAARTGWTPRSIGSMCCRGRQKIKQNLGWVHDSPTDNTGTQQATFERGE